MSIPIGIVLHDNHESHWMQVSRAVAQRFDLSTVHAREIADEVVRFLSDFDLVIPPWVILLAQKKTTDDMSVVADWLEEQGLSVERSLIRHPVHGYRSRLLACIILEVYAVPEELARHRPRPRGQWNGEDVLIDPRTGMVLVREARTHFSRHPDIGHDARPHVRDSIRSVRVMIEAHRWISTDRI